MMSSKDRKFYVREFGPAILLLVCIAACTKAKIPYPPAVVGSDQPVLATPPKPADRAPNPTTSPSPFTSPVVDISPTPPPTEAEGNVQYSETHPAGAFYGSWSRTKDQNQSSVIRICDSDQQPFNCSTVCTIHCSAGKCTATDSKNQTYAPLVTSTLGDGVRVYSLNDPSIQTAHSYTIVVVDLLSTGASQ